MKELLSWEVKELSRMFLSAGCVFLLIRLLAKPYSLIKGN